MFVNKIETIKCLDSSGSTSSQRFEYQVACVFLTFLTLYKKTSDFFILLDYIDDFVVVENQNTPNETISFVQVKTQKDKPISIATVVKKEWILKQSNNYKQFLDEKVKNILMTNLGVSFNQKVIANTDLVCLGQCDGYEGIEKLKQQMVDNGFSNLNDFYLMRASISLDSFEQELKGVMLNYIQDNNMASLTVESIETIYLKIWQDLIKKQTYVPTSADEQLTADELVLKKGVKYSFIKDVFRIMADVQLPDEGKISDFCHSNKLYYESQSFNEFGRLFKNFRIDAAKSGMEVIEEAFGFLNENKSKLYDTQDDKFGFSKTAFEILCMDKTIKDSIFFKEYWICISILYTYKSFNF